MKWEYKVLPPTGNLEVLNDLGKKGWELVCIEAGKMYFNRQRKFKLFGKRERVL